MPNFGHTSQKRLDTTHPRIKELFEKVVEEYDCSILEGLRTLDRQQMLFDSNRSKTMNSKHLGKNGVSYAVDVVPYPISWGEKEHKELLHAFDKRDSKVLKEKLNEYQHVMARFYHFAGYVLGVAEALDIKIRWGGDWDSDKIFTDQTFHDLPHFEFLGD